MKGTTPDRAPVKRYIHTFQQDGPNAREVSTASCAMLLDNLREKGRLHS